jgi:hypothetical protein
MVAGWWTPWAAGLVTGVDVSHHQGRIDWAVLARTDVRIPSYPSGATGGQPITATFSPDGNILYVGSAGSNALTVLTRSGKGWTVAGAIPSGWFPTALAAAADGSVLVLTLKGTGYFADPKLGPGVVHDGASLSRIPAPTKEQLAAGTREVQAANSPSYDSNKAEVSNLASLGIETAGLDRLIQGGYHLLGLQTYFTAGEQEVRAWTIHRGDTAPKAAGVIHTDFEKGFIRAETVAYQDFITHGGWKTAKEKGAVRSEGKEYVVQDGDVLLFRFNV